MGTPAGQSAESPCLRGPPDIPEAEGLVAGNGSQERKKSGTGVPLPGTVMKSHNRCGHAAGYRPSAAGKTLA